jgi:ATP-dependent RNA helicase DeaD
LLKEDKSGLVMVFCNTQRNTDFVANNLRNLGINALAIHGGHSQDKRNRTLDKFHDKNVDVLVCTDVAARGLDIKGVSHVYNYDSPNETNNYIHRIGRTARAGKEGKAVSIISSRDYENFTRIKRQNPEIERQDVPDFPRAQITFKHEPRFGGSRFGNRERGFGGRRQFGGHRSFHNSHSSSETGGYRRDRGSSRDFEERREHRGSFIGRRERGRFHERGDSRGGRFHGRQDRRAFRHSRHAGHRRF